MRAHWTVLGLLLACADPQLAAHDADAAAAPGDGRAAADAGTEEAGSDPVPDAGATPPLPLPRYSVPVDAPELRPYSFYPVASAKGVIRRGTLKLEYPFPEQLTGNAVLIDLEGPYAPGQTHVEVTAGAYGRGECDLVEAVWVCFEELPGVDVDPAAAEATMQAAGLGRAEIDFRLEITRRFSIDPIGIFEMDAASVAVRDDDDDDD